MEPEVSGYQILGDLGAGSGGRVYQARQAGTDRIVALKILSGTSFIGRERFAREIATLGRLNHPNVVQVFQAGDCAAGPFFVMEWMPGGSLAERIRRDGPLPAVSAAAVIEGVARGVAAAHAADIFHRDLKPGNVLLTSEGTAKVADFGLARWSDLDALASTADPVTPTTALLGTPAYMAPEQAACRPKDIDERSDVYGVGAVLYHVLTGEPPFSGPTPIETARKVQTEDPIPPRRRNPDIPRGLETICLKCMEKTKPRRYATAADVADDVARWRRGEPTIARAPTWLGRLARRAWRVRRPLARAAAIVLGTLLVVAAGTILLRPDPDRELKAIRKELRGTEPVKLVGESGLPRWHRWDGAAGTFTESNYNDGTCSFHAAASAFLVLLPTEDVPAAYLLRADVRHEVASDGASRAGLFFGRRGEDLPDGTRLSYWHRVVFNDHLRFTHAKTGKPLPNYMGFAPLVLHRTEGELPSGGPNPTALLEITTLPQVGPRPWRTIWIEVRPDTIRLRSAENGGLALPFQPAIVKVPRLAEIVLHTRRGELPGAADPDELPVLSGSLGLYVAEGQASFRNVEITRLDD
jgi:serine/threonine-protein kinase